jgi:hypothetical protein
MSRMYMDSSISASCYGIVNLATELEMLSIKKRLNTDSLSSSYVSIMAKDSLVNPTCYECYQTISGSMAYKLLTSAMRTNLWLGYF